MNRNRIRQRQIPNDIVRYVNHSMDISKQINFILVKQGKTHKDLAVLLGKSTSQISSLLRGTHNFTLKSISKIEAVLNEDILICTKIKI